MLSKLKLRVLDTLAHWSYRKDYLLSQKELQPIVETAPVPSYEGSDTDVFVLTGGEDIYGLFLALKSLVFWTERRFRINIACDDGMLLPWHVDAIQKFVPGANLITERPAILEQLKPYPAITKFHLDATDPSYPKLSIPALYARKDKVILMDTDLIFFRPPRMLIDWVDDPADQTDYYRNPVKVNDPYQFPKLEEELQARFGIGPRPMLESGLLLFHRDLLRLDRLEVVSVAFDRHGFRQWSKELEIYNVLYRIRGRLKPLPRWEYGGVWTYDAAAVHYFSKHMFIKPSLLHLVSLIEFIKFAEENRFTPSQAYDM
jgi:hypothetical protein